MRGLTAALNANGKFKYKARFIHKYLNLVIPKCS